MHGRSYGVAKVFIDVEKDMYIDQVCRDNQIHQKM